MSDKDYPNWGGRGIRVCEKWRNDFMAFFTDMGERPSEKHSIDRLNSNGDYSPDNCRWATIAQQGSENRRGITSITVNGIEFPSIKAACIHFDVGYTTVFNRLKTGIPIDIAFSENRLKSRRDKKSYLRKDLR